MNYEHTKSSTTNQKKNQRSDYFCYEEIDSTSSEAKNLIKVGYKPPFAVIASTQSKGRGQVGAKWQSPLGGLYLTIVLDKSFSTPMAPLKTAIVIALWLKDNTTWKSV